MGLLSSLFNAFTGTKSTKFQRDAVAIITSNDLQFITTVKVFICGSDSVLGKALGQTPTQGMPLLGRGMCLLVYAHAKRTAKTQIGCGSQDFIKYHAQMLDRAVDAHDNHGIEAYMTGLVAAFVMMLVERFECNPTYKKDHIQIWLALAEGCISLKLNPEWDTHYKSKWFEATQYDKDPVRYCLDDCLPKGLRNEPEILAFKNEHQL